MKKGCVEWGRHKEYRSKNRERGLKEKGRRKKRKGRGYVDRKVGEGKGEL